MSSNTNQNDSIMNTTSTRRSQSRPDTAENEESSNNNNNANNNNRNNNNNSISLEEVMYSASSYHAIVTPVLITMILSALAVTYVTTEEQRDSTERALNNMYTPFNVDGGDDDDGSGDSNAKKLGLSLVNALIIVSVIAVMTFGVVLLYKYRCLKFLMAYMIISSAVLLGLLGGLMFQVFLDRYRIPLDQISFYYTIVNFAAVGTIAIFYQRGIPLKITQSYLVATSVILAWQLSHFHTWTAWSLLVLLALYDLCAVLTPCGPLKALVKLMSKEDAPEMPGLLYEGHLPAGVERPSRNNGGNGDTPTPTTTAAATTSGHHNDGENESRSEIEMARKSHNHNTYSNVPESTVMNNGDYYGEGIHSSSNAKQLQQENASFTGNNGVSIAGPDSNSNVAQRSSSSISTTGRPTTTPLASSVVVSPSNSNRDNDDGSASIEVQQYYQSTNQESALSKTSTATSSAEMPINRGRIPLAIAMVYRLRIQSPQRYSTLHENMTREENPVVSNDFSPDELRSMVVARFPRSGGKIVMNDNDDEYNDDNVSNTNSRRQRNRNESELKCTVFDRHGVVKRVLLVNKNGKVFEEVEGERENGNHDNGSSGPGNNSIKLGLGDFIFYSVLVAKASQHSFTTFAACMLIILSGLGATLILLSVYHKALPALPISILLGVIFYLVTRALIEPFIRKMLLSPIYV